MRLLINNIQLKQEDCIKYLGILIDSNLSWKNQVNYIIKKIKRNIGIISKLRYYIDSKTLLHLYYALIYPFLTYGIIAWGNTYHSTLQPLYILQKKIMRIITFSKFDEPSSPLFGRLKVVKLPDLVHFHIIIFMYKFNNKLLPIAFRDLLTPVG